jgi:hypothetical protein
MTAPGCAISSGWRWRGGKTMAALHGLKRFGFLDHYNDA